MSFRRVRRPLTCRGHAAGPHDGERSLVPRLHGRDHVAAVHPEPRRRHDRHRFSHVTGCVMLCAEPVVQRSAPPIRAVAAQRDPAQQDAANVLNQRERQRIPLGPPGGASPQSALRQDQM